MTKARTLTLLSLCAVTIFILPYGLSFVGRTHEVATLPLSLRLSIPDAISLNRTTVLLVELRATVNLANVTSWILTPSGIIVNESDSLWRGDLLANHPVSWSVNITCITNGYWDIEGRVVAKTDSGTLAARDTLYLRVFGDCGEASSIPFSHTTSDRPAETRASRGSKTGPSFLEKV